MKPALNSTKGHGTLEGFRSLVYDTDMNGNADMTTTEAIAAWCRWANAGGLARHTANQYASMVSEFFRECGREFYDVAPQDLVDWAERLNARGPTVSSCGYKALTNFWRWLRANGLDDRAITDHMPYTQPRRKIPVAFTRAELEQVLAGAEGLVAGRHGPSAHLYFKFLYFTGARSRESLSVELNDLGDQAVLLRNTKRSGSGGGAERLIPLSAAGQDLVGAWREDVKRKPHELTIFPFGHTTAAYWCKRLSEELAIHVHPHKFRATFATNLLERGVDIRTVQDLLGHADVSTTMRYLAVTDERKLAAVAVL